MYAELLVFIMLSANCSLHVHVITLCSTKKCDPFDYLKKSFSNTSFTFHALILQLMLHDRSVIGHWTFMWRQHAAEIVARFLKVQCERFEHAKLWWAVYVCLFRIL